MMQDLMLFSHQTAHNIQICSILCHNHINATVTDNIQEIKVGLSLHSPAFLLVDFYIKGADSLLSEIIFGHGFPQPYIMISASYADGNERADMFRRGADYCIDYPINANEVLAVINSVLRRSKPMNTIVYKEMVIDKSNQTVTMQGKPVPLTRKEYDVLYALASHIGEVLTKEEIYRAVWGNGYHANGTNVSDQVSSLRAKLGFSRKDDTYIHTVFGVGYRFGKAM